MRETNQVIEPNEKAKDTFFKLMYESEERRRMLAAYLTGINPEDAKIKNVRPILFGTKENDLAFLCDETIYFMVEEQSSICKNIPYRLLEYITTGLRNLVSSEDSLYGQNKIMFPTPKLYVVNVGLERSRESISNQVNYDLKLSDSFVINKNNVKSDLELIVHAVDMRMFFEETLAYIESECIPSRFISIEKNLCDYALLANSLRYVQESMKAETKYKKATNVSNEAELFAMLRSRGLFVDLLSNEEVCNVTAAQFSREDIFRSQGKAEGLAEGEQKAISSIVKSAKRHNESKQVAIEQIIEDLQYSKEKATEVVEKIWTDIE